MMCAVDVCIECRKFVVEGIAHEALGSEVVALVRLHGGNNLEDTCEALNGSGMQNDLVLHRPQSRQPVHRVLQSYPPNQAVDLITFREQEFRQIRSILSGDSRNQSSS